MGKDSEFYRDKTKNKKIKLRTLINELPGFARDYIHSKEVSAQTSTLISYCFDLLTFFRFMSDNNPVLRGIAITDYDFDLLKSIQSEDIIEYQRYLELNIDGEQHENGKKAIARKMTSLRGMYEYHYMHKNITENPMLLVPLPRINKDKNIIRMTNYEVQSILDVIESGNASMTQRQRNYIKKTKKRDLAILTLMLNTGIRVSECNGLDINDVDLIVNSLTIVRKGGGQDLIYFGEDVHNVLDDYINTERKTINPCDGHEKALFYSMQGKRMSVNAIENLVKKFAKMAVPTKKITPHKLRSTYGTALYRETGDIRLVADVLGHENVNTTVNYYAAIEDEHKRQAANAVDFQKKDQ